MIFPPDAVRTVSIFHLPTTAGASQAYSASADVTTSAAVLPLDRKENAFAGMDLIEPWELYMDTSVDIRLNDKVTVATLTGNFYVVKIFMAAFGGLRHQRVTISKQV